MTTIPRAALAIFGLLFTFSHVILGLGWLEKYSNQALTLFAFGLYLVCAVTSIVLYHGLALPTAHAVVTVIAAAVIPILCYSQLKVSDLAPGGSYLTWFIGATSTMLAVVALRGRLVLALVGLAFVIAETLAWGGFNVVSQVGLIGAFQLVGAATAVSLGLQASRRAAKKYGDMASAVEAQTARQTASRLERKNRIESALQAAQPVLQRIIDLRGKLSEADRYELLLTEFALRDEVQGGNLLDNGVRIAIRDARRRGVEVTIFDEGGMEDANPEDANAMRNAIARAIDSADKGTVAVRSPKDETFMVSITSQRPTEDGPDLWLRLP
jgi:hypothetical protein